MIKIKLTPLSGLMMNSPPLIPAMKMVEMGIHSKMTPALGEGSASVLSMIMKARNRMSSPSKQVVIRQTDSILIYMLKVTSRTMKTDEVTVLHLYHVSLLHIQNLLTTQFEGVH